MPADFSRHGIDRYSGGAEGRSRAAVHAGLVYTVATAPDAAADLRQQTANTLSLLERNLIDAGSSREHIITATVYITDITEKKEMDAAWCAWIGEPENWPQRACVQAQLAPDTLVEIVVIAALA